MKQNLTAATLIASLIASLTLAAGPTRAAEAIDPYSDPDTTWVLQVLDGQVFEAGTTLSFPEPGRVAGKATCNNYSGEMTATYPEFEVGPLISTRMACPDMELEQVFLDALAAMRGAVATDYILVLTGPDGGEMVFTPADQAPR